MSSPSDSDAPRVVGVVWSVKPEKGFGFIRCTEGKKVEDIFFHRTGLEEGTTIFDLREGEQVEFAMELTPKGKRAEHITRVP